MSNQFFEHESNEDNVMTFVCSLCGAITNVIIDNHQPFDSNMLYFCEHMKCPKCKTHMHVQIYSEMIPILQLLSSKGYNTMIMSSPDNPSTMCLYFYIRNLEIPDNFIDPTCIRLDQFQIKRNDDKFITSYRISIPNNEKTDYQSLYEWADSLMRIPHVRSLISSPFTLSVYNKNFSDVIDEKITVIITLTYKSDNRCVSRIIDNIPIKHPEVSVDTINISIPLENNDSYTFVIHGFVECRHINLVLETPHYGEDLCDNMDVSDVNVDVIIK